MRALLPILMIGLAGCAARPPAPANAAPAAIAPVAPAPAALADRPPPRSVGPNRCQTKSKIETPKPLEISEAATCADHHARESVLAQKLKSKFSPTVPNGRVEVTFDCDPLTANLEEIVFEFGSGHGGGLEVWRLYRDAEKEKDFHALGFSDQGSPYSHAGVQFMLARGSVSGSAVDKALATALPALTAIIREIEPPPSPDGHYGRSMFMSSGNFHHFIRVRDESHHQVERTFTGYPSSSGQRDYLGLQIAIEQLTPLVETLAFAPGEPTEAEKQFFVSIFLAAKGRLDARYAWWVRDRYFKLAEHAGTPAVLSPVVADLRNNLAVTQAEEKSDAERHLESDLALIAKITAWDPRKDENGAARPLGDVAREVLDECDPGQSPAAKL